MADFVAEYAVIVALAIAAGSAAYSISTMGNAGHETSKLLTFRVSTSAAGIAIPIVFGTQRIGGNMIWAGDFASSQQSSGGKGKGGSQNVYSISFAMGLCEGPIAGIGKVWADKDRYSSLAALLAKNGSGTITVMVGDYPQSPWTYLTTKHPTLALNYPGIAYIGAVNYALGNYNHIPNLNYEVQGFNIYPGKEDANPAEVITSILTDSIYGLNLSPDLLDVDDFSIWCLAQDFLLSPVFSSQQKALDSIADILAQTFSTFIIHDSSVLKIMPLGDQEITGNGVTWTPNLTACYDLTDDDFISDNSSSPIKITRSTPADAFNSVKLEWINRANDYSIAVVDYHDQSSIDQYILRQDSTKTCHAITRASVARNLVQLIGQRNLYVRNQYTFTLGIKYCLLEPMDIVTLTDEELGLDKTLVRIQSIEEDQNYNLNITAEELIIGTGRAAAYDTISNEGYLPDGNIDPGPTNTPIIFQVPQSMASGSLPELWIAASGVSANWGGCNIWASVDNLSYQFIGTVYKSKQGVTSSGINSGTDPDTINTLGVDLTESKGELISGTQQDADLQHTLCYVDGEFISYETATLTDTYKYTIETYLRRGLNGSLIGNHATGSAFALMNNAIFKYAIPPLYQGLNIYLKFQSFNINYNGHEDLSALTHYTHAITAAPTPYSHQSGLTIAVPDTGLAITYSPAFSSMVGTPLVVILNFVAGDTIVITGSTTAGFTVQVTNGGVGVARNINWMSQGT